MMTNVDEEFIKDLDKCLKAADELSELDTEEARLFVSQQLQDLHRFLQKKQKDAEVRVEEEIKKEENEIDKLQNRIDHTAKSDGANESDIAYTDLGRLWAVLKDEFWQLAFNAFISETKDSVKTILENLIAILNASFHHCKERASKSRAGMMFQVYNPGENALQNKNLKIPKPLDQSLEDICKTCQIKSTPFCLPSVQQAVMVDVKSDRSVAKLFKSESKMLSKAVTKYLEKCVEFCWIACLEEPAVRIITSPLKECKNISQEFIGIDRVTYKARPNAAYVKLPALVQGDKILMPWHLYTINQPRPEAKDMRGDPSQDYRVTRVENRDGRLINDPEEDKSNQEKQQTPSETNSAETIREVSRVQDKTAAVNETNQTDTMDTSKSDNSKISESEAKTQEKSDQKQGYKLAQKTKKDTPNLDF